MLAGCVPVTQALADRLIAAGYAGIQVRSHATGAGLADLKLVLWKWGTGLRAHVILIDDEGRLSGGPAQSGGPTLGYRGLDAAA